MLNEEQKKQIRQMAADGVGYRETMKCVLASKQDIIEKLPDVSVKTIELVLGKMVRENRITKIGTYKDARYMRKSEK